MPRKLTPAQRRNPEDTEAIYCGPYALCVVSGKHYEEVRRVINRIRKIKDRTTPVTKVYEKEIKPALLELGLSCLEKDVRVKGRPTKTLRQLATEVIPKKYRQRPVIVMISGHFLVLHQFRVLDTWTGEWTPLGRYPTRRRAIYYWVIDP